MSWIKEANKLGKYKSTHLGFRIYYVVEPTCVTTTEIREDGVYQVTKFTPGEYKAINGAKPLFKIF